VGELYLYLYPTELVRISKDMQNAQLTNQGYTVLMKASLSSAALRFVKFLQLRHGFNVSKGVVRFTARERWLLA
jgi:hypothetical protein